jgi:hypothetical protein
MKVEARGSTYPMQRTAITQSNGTTFPPRVTASSLLSTMMYSHPQSAKEAVSTEINTAPAKESTVAILRTSQLVKQQKKENGTLWVCGYRAAPAPAA